MKNKKQKMPDKTTKRYRLINILKKKSILISYMLFISISSLAQIDSAYIEAFDQELSIRPYVYKKFTTLSTEIGEAETDYYPNTPVGIGFGATYKKYSLSGGYAFGFMRDKNKGKTESIDFQYHYYGRDFVFDFFFQDYKGFYREDNKQNEVYYIYPDIKLVQYGIFSQYVFNSKKFSYQAAFNQSEKQLRSAGSFQLGGGLYYNKVRSDSTITLPDNKLINYQISISGGYAYTWVIKRNFFTSLSVSLGINLGAERISDFTKKIELSPSVFPRFSMGYNGKDWSIGLSFVMNRIYVSHDDKTQKIALGTGSFQLSYIKRINIAPKFLKQIKYIN